MGDRAGFEDFIQKNFVEKKKNGSKVITRGRGAQISEYLSGSRSVEDSHFKFWVKSRGFKLMDYPVLGLKNVLCLPVKKKVMILLGQTYYCFVGYLASRSTRSLHRMRMTPHYLGAFVVLRL